MNLESIKKLFKGSKEDMIIACSHLAKREDIITVMKEWEEEYREYVDLYFLSGRPEPQRPAIVFYPTHYAFSNRDNFYYQLPSGHYLVCSPGKGVGYCYENYSTTLEVIRDF